MVIVESLAAHARKCQVDGMAERLAGGTTEELGRTCQSTGDDGGTGGVADERAAWPAIRKRHLGTSHSQATGVGAYAPSARPAEERVGKDSRPLFHDLLYFTLMVGWFHYTFNVCKERGLLVIVGEARGVEPV